MTVFRPARIDDAPRMAALMADAFDPRFGEGWTGAQLFGTMALPGARAELALADARLSGFTLVRAAADEVELLLIAVDARDRGRGLGRRLLDRAVAAATDAGARTIYLEVRACNATARRLYSSAGFTDVGIRKSYYHGLNSERFDAITMSMML